MQMTILVFDLVYLFSMAECEWCGDVSWNDWSYTQRIAIINY